MRSRLLSFLPYGIASGVHLAALLAGSDFGSMVSKPLLMPTLLFGVLVSLRAGSALGQVAILASLPLLFSLVGDVLLQTPGDLGFLVGLGCFLLTHAAYLVLFLGALRQRRIPLSGVLYAVWWLAFLLVLAPSLGSLVAVLALYGLVLAASSAAALGTNRLVAVGALLFLLSDSVLALKFFVGLAFYPVDFVIMVLYIAGQGLIALGIVRGGVRTGERAEVAPPVLAARAVPGDNR